jgi:hypothetical protein
MLHKHHPHQSTHHTTFHNRFSVTTSQPSSNTTFHNRFSVTTSQPSSSPTQLQHHPSHINPIIPFNHLSFSAKHARARAGAVHRTPAATRTARTSLQI